MKKNISLTAALLLSATPIFAQDAIILDEIVVTATASPIELSKSGATMTLLSPKDLTSTGNGSLTSALTKTSGVSYVGNGGVGANANLFVRGLSSRYIATYVDGIDVSDPSNTNVQYDNFGGLLSSNTKRVELLKGSQSALRGSNAVAGVLTIDTLGMSDADNTSKQEIDISYGSKNTLSASYSYLNRINALTTSFSISHYETDGISSASTLNTNHPTNEKNSEQDSFTQDRVAFGAEYKLNDAVSFGANVFKEKSKAEFDEYYSGDYENGDYRYGPVDGTPDDYGTRDATGYRFFTKFQTGNWAHDINYSNYVIDRFATSPSVAPLSTAGSYESTFTGKRQTINYMATGDISDTLLLSLGATQTKDKAISNKLLGGSKNIEINSVFAEAIYTPTDRFTSIANIRNDDNSIFGSATTYRLASSYFVNDTTNLRAAIATGYRAPAADELFGQYPESDFVGNPDLLAEESTSYEIGFDTEIGSASSFSATVFKTDITNQVKYKYIPRMGYLENVKKTETNGVEFTFNTQLSESTSLSANWMKLSTLDSDANPISGAPTQQLTFGVNQEFTEKLNGGFTYSLVKGVAAADDVNSTLDLNITYQVSDTIQGYLNIDNAMDAQNETASGYSAPGRMIYAGLRASF